MDNEELLVKYLKAKGTAQSSITSYVYSYKTFTQWAASQHLEMAYVTYTELLTYIAYLRKRNITQHSIRGYMMALTHYFEALVEAEVLPENPARYLKLKAPTTRKLYPILSKEQLEHLYTQFDINGLRKTKPTSQASAMRNKIATGLMVYQGLGVNALSRLSVSDVNILSGKLIVQGSRSHSTRTLALQAIQIIELDRYINHTRKELQSHFDQEAHPALLITGYTHYRDAHNKRVMSRLRHQEPQLQSAHHIRASVITHWLKQYNLREVQYMAGHKTIFSTEKYLQNDTEGLQLDIDRLHPMNELKIQHQRNRSP